MKSGSVTGCKPCPRGFWITVVLHEVTHFVEREHNTRFWQLVNAHAESPRARGFLGGC
ncbi:YgjP-like metallopeptidase domain-containing protein [Propioniciclava flava]